jgi:2-keto-4-pentenoate hydratase
MREAYDPEPAADLLEHAWRTGAQLASLPDPLRPQTLDQGYAVQDRLVARIDEPIAGWKLGVGSVNAKRREGFDRALVGRVLQSRCISAPATVALPNRSPLTIEIEIGLVLGRDIAPGEKIGRLADVIGAVHLTSELVLSRFIHFLDVGWPSFVADNAAFQALVVGPAIPLDAVDACLEQLTARVGETELQSLDRDDRADPYASLRDLLAFCGEHRITLAKGSIVSTGAILRPFTTDGADVQVTAAFGANSFTFQTRHA